MDKAVAKMVKEQPAPLTFYDFPAHQRLFQPQNRGSSDLLCPEPPRQPAPGDHRSHFPGRHYLDSQWAEHFLGAGQRSTAPAFYLCLDTGIGLAELRG